MKQELMGLKLKQEIVKFNEIEVIVKELTAGDASEYQNSLFEIVNGKPVPKTKDMQAKLICYSCYEPSGERMFGIKDIEQVKQLPASIVDRLYAVADKLNSESAKN